MSLRPVETLEPPQRQTLELLADGLSNVQIAQHYRTSLESTGAMLEELYGALGIESGLPKQAKREMAIVHFKKSDTISATFDQRTALSLLEGFKPWQRQALTLFAQERPMDVIASETGVSSDAVEQTVSQFMASAKLPTRNKAVEVLKRVVTVAAQPIVTGRGYTNGHDKSATAAPVARPTTQTQSSAAPSPQSALPQRDRQILDLIEEGLRNEQIADKLDMAVTTVQTAVSLLYKRFGLSRGTMGRNEMRKALIGYWQAQKAGEEPNVGSAETPQPAAQPAARPPSVEDDG